MGPSTRSGDRTWNREGRLPRSNGGGTEESRGPSVPQGVKEGIFLTNVVVELPDCAHELLISDSWGEPDFVVAVRARKNLGDKIHLL